MSVIMHFRTFLCFDKYAAEIGERSRSGDENAAKLEAAWNAWLADTDNDEAQAKLDLLADRYLLAKKAEREQQS